MPSLEQSVVLSKYLRKYLFIWLLHQDTIIKVPLHTDATTEKNGIKQLSKQSF